MKITQPGVYRGITEADYRADPFDGSFTQSIAKVLLAHSALHAREESALAEPREEDDEAEKYVKAQAIGNAVHKTILGRGKDIEVIDAKDFKKDVAKQARDAATAAGRVPILAKHKAIADRMSQRAYEQLLRHEDKDAFTNGSGEVMIAWQEDGVWFRALIDWLSHDLRTIDDFKSSGMSMAAHVLGKRAETAGWHVQHAFIRRGLDVLDPANAGRRRHRNIAQEQFHPFALNVMHHDKYWLTMGEKKVEAAVTAWKAARKSNRWACYPPVSVCPEYPKYAESQWLDRELSGEFEPDTKLIMAG
jgi:PDDEXK-like uncharacterized protein DUF3799